MSRATVTLTLDDDGSVTMHGPTTLVPLDRIRDAIGRDIGDVDTTLAVLGEVFAAHRAGTVPITAVQDIRRQVTDALRVTPEPLPPVSALLATIRELVAERDRLAADAGAPDVIELSPPPAWVACWTLDQAGALADEWTPCDALYAGGPIRWKRTRDGQVSTWDDVLTEYGPVYRRDPLA